MVKFFHGISSSVHSNKFVFVCILMMFVLPIFSTDNKVSPDDGLWPNTYENENIKQHCLIFGLLQATQH